MIFLPKSMEIHDLNLFKINSFHVPAWKTNLDKLRGIVTIFGVNLEQTDVDLGHEMTCNFHENPYHISYSRCPEFITKFFRTTLKILT